MSPAFADSDVPARTLHVVSPDELSAFREKIPEIQDAWLAGTDFAASLGDVRLLPDSTGRVEAAAVGHGTATARRRGRFGLAKALGALPAGAWQLAGALTQAERHEAALGWLLAGYRFDRYRPSTTATPLPSLVLPEGCDGPRLLAMAEGEFLTRDLINTPASDLGPAELQAAFEALAARFGATCAAIVGDELLARGFPMVHAVGRASPRAPRLLDMRWGDLGPRITLVGKGVCFDTGGLNLKPDAGMLLMKKDMGGAATVMGLAQMIMTLGLPVRLRVIVPAVENAVSGSAMRPRDILTSRKGLTVEVNNTDAEGRLILGDALAFADEEECDVIVSMATLTGAARVALGPDLAPFFTDDERIARALADAAPGACDPVWRMPLWAPYETMIEPGIADLDNAPSGGMAGAVTAALFLRRFVDNRAYVHFDIYGHMPADQPGRPRGGVGMGARALLAALPGLVAL